MNDGIRRQIHAHYQLSNMIDRVTDHMGDRSLADKHVARGRVVAALDSIDSLLVSEVDDFRLACERGAAALMVLSWMARACEERLAAGGDGGG